MENEKIYLNGKFYTMDEENRIVEAIAVKNGRIATVGTNQDVLSAKTEKTEVIDLKGEVVLPGICDCHVHILGAGEVALLINAFDKSKEEILEAVRKRVETAEPGQWIMGMGWNQDFWEDNSFPTKEELDAVAPNNPVRLTRYCGNAYWCNSKALKAAGLLDGNSNETASIGKGTEFLVNEKGEPLGTLVGSSCHYIDEAIPPLSEEEYQGLILSAQREMLKYGITAAMDKGLGGTSALCDDCGRFGWKMVKSLYEKGQMKIRLYEALIGTDEFFDDCFENGAQINLYDDKLTMRGIKLWSDGAFGPRTAWISEDYKGQKGHCGNQKFSDEELIGLFKKADENGLQITIHTIGDASSKQILDCYEKAFEGDLKKDRRMLIEHFHVPTPEDIERLTKYGIINSTQFIQFSSDMEVIQDILPEDMIGRLYPWRQVLDQGGILCNGSDGPVDPVNPFPPMYVAVTRKSVKGVNLIEEEPLRKLNRLEALRAYTTIAAYARFRENEEGSLETGKVADFIVIDKDYFQCEEEEIKDIKVKKTFIDGEIAFEAM